jgi:hypothetical protein
MMTCTWSAVTPISSNTRVYPSNQLGFLLVGFSTPSFNNNHWHLAVFTSTAQP